MAEGSVRWMHSQLRTATKQQQQQASKQASKQASDRAASKQIVYACLSSNMRQRDEPSFSSILTKMISKLPKHFCPVVFVDISLQTATWCPTTQQPDRLRLWNFARLSSNMRQRGEPSFSSILSKMIAKLLKHFCFVVVCWHFTANKDMIPNNSTTRLSLPMKFCTPFK